MKERTYEVVYRDKCGRNCVCKVLAVSVQAAIVLAQNADILFDVFKRIYVY